MSLPYCDTWLVRLLRQWDLIIPCLYLKTGTDKDPNFFVIWGLETSLISTRLVKVIVREM